MTPHNVASGMGMQCLPMTHKIIMQAIVSYPLHTHNEHDENEILKKMRLSTCIMKQSSLLKRLWLKAVTEPNSAKPTAIAEWERAESTGKYGNVRFSDTGI